MAPEIAAVADAWLSQPDGYHRADDVVQRHAREESGIRARRHGRRLRRRTWSNAACSRGAATRNRVTPEHSPTWESKAHSSCASWSIPRATSRRQDRVSEHDAQDVRERGARGAAQVALRAGDDRRTFRRTAGRSGVSFRDGSLALIRAGAICSGWVAAVGLVRTSATNHDKCETAALGHPRRGQHRGAESDSGDARLPTGDASSRSRRATSEKRARRRARARHSEGVTGRTRSCLPIRTSTRSTIRCRIICTCRGRFARRRRANTCSARSRSRSTRPKPARSSTRAIATA